MTQHYTFDELQKMQRHQTDEAIFVFDDATRDLEFVDLSKNENLREIRFEKPQPNLRYLDASYCGLEKITFSADCPTLQTLYLHHNNLQNIDFEANFPKLQLLDLSFNSKLQNLKFQKHLPQLTYLYLHACDLRSLEHLARYFVKPEFDFNIEENGNISSPDLDMIAQGKAAVKIYFASIYASQEKGEDTIILYETKLMILGNGEAGKTTFARKMEHGFAASMPSQDERTRGLEISDWKPFTFHDNKDRKSDFYLHVWDLGGQNIYQGTHQMFFSDKSLYVLVAENRRADTDFNYWLNSVRQLAGTESRVLVVMNKKAGGEANFEDKITSENLKIVLEEFKLDLKDDKVEIEKLQERFKYHLKGLKGMAVSPAWAKLRKSLEAREDNFISFADFCEDCVKQGIEDEETIKSILNYFNRVGVLTHIDKAGLNERIYLNPDWLVKIVYEILDNDIVRDNKGRITGADIANIWKKKNKLGYGVEPLSRLLHHYNLMYHVSNTENYVVPAKLPGNCPYSEWEHQSQKDILQFRYHFDNHMPKGLMPRIIVSLHRYIKNQVNVWEKGFNIEDEGAFAEIKKINEYNHFHIRVVGQKKMALLAKITHCIDEILDGFKGLEYHKFVPCICSTCKKRDTPHFYKNSELSDRKETGKITIECGFKPYQDVNVVDLLEGVDSNQTKKGEFMMEKEEKKRNIKIFVSYSSADRRLRAIISKYLNTSLESSRHRYTTWTDVELTVNDDWNEKIQKALTNSDIGILLVSPAFLGSKYAMGDEFRKMLESREQENYMIVPVLVRKCRFFNHEDLKKMQFFKTYKDEYGVTDLLERDELMPFEDLADVDNPNLKFVNNYFEKLAEQIDKAVDNN